MQRDHGRWRCDLCGALLDTPPSSPVPRSFYCGASGRQTVRVIRVEQREVHRCVMRP